MSASLRQIRSARSSSQRLLASPSLSRCGRTAQYRRIQSSTYNTIRHPGDYELLHDISSLTLRCPFTSNIRPHSTSRNLRSFSSNARLFYAIPAEEDLKQPSKANEAKPSAEEPAKSSSEQSAKDHSSDGKKGEGEGEGEGDAKKEDKKAPPPPPPPHGDKTPWQVFTETLQTEFKASKEWNDSTKALASGAQQFTENERIQKARAAYSKASGAVGTGTAEALKTTGRAIGQSAAWTWDTSVVKGVRKGATVVGTGFDKATKPIRETEAFKSVKQVVDDGSSSRYGGWVEKEERRKVREAREIADIKSGRRPGQKIEEDPK